jgi:hypothetical protein
MKHVHLIGDFIPNNQLHSFCDKNLPVCVLDMRILKTEQEIFSALQIGSWLDLLECRYTFIVRPLEGLIRMNKSILEALIYLCTNSSSNLVTCSRYSWFTFAFYSPFVKEHQIDPIHNGHLGDDKCFGIVKSILSKLVGDDRGIRLAFEMLKGHFDYATPDAMAAFKKFQVPATNYLNSLGIFPGIYKDLLFS